ncbi:MAG: FAD/NAD(P)-binding oxidoreductase [Owenweeksia sp.]|nr:FAD/NAD(P)-binding oxidoreductase [Owenweeksia sp.]
MKNLIILGAGTAGTMMSNHLRRALSSDEWNISIVDQRAVHHYQPGYLFIPFGVYEEEDVIKPTRKFIHEPVKYVQKASTGLTRKKTKSFYLMARCYLTIC